ncbi:MAG: hypothetical protein V3T83_21500 [Acidobacteriota bacterium]
MAEHPFRQSIVQRHSPSFRDYLRKNFQISAARTNEARKVATLTGYTLP